MSKIVCGTHSGYVMHVKNKEEVCGPCRKAKQEYNARRRFKNGSQKMPWKCSRCGSVFRDHRCGMEGIA